VRYSANTCPLQEEWLTSPLFVWPVLNKMFCEVPAGRSCYCTHVSSAVLRWECDIHALSEEENDKRYQRQVFLNDKCGCGISSLIPHVSFRENMTLKRYFYPVENHYNSMQSGCCSHIKSFLWHFLACAYFLKRPLGRLHLGVVRMETLFMLRGKERQKISSMTNVKYIFNLQMWPKVKTWPQKLQL